MPTDSGSDIIRPRNTSKKWKRIRQLSPSDESYLDFNVNLEIPEMVQIEKDKKRKRARNEDAPEFHVLDLSLKRGRPKIYGNIKLLPLYTTTRLASEENHKDIMCLQPYIPPGTF